MELTAAGVALGTPQYMSPEQAQGLTTVDHRTDVWGLGVVLYEALAGVPAYPELADVPGDDHEILTERPPQLSVVAPWVPEELAHAVHEAIEHDVEKRLQDCVVFADGSPPPCPTPCWDRPEASSHARARLRGSTELNLPAAPPVGRSCPLAPSPWATTHRSSCARATRPRTSRTSFRRRRCSPTVSRRTRREQPKVIVHEPAPAESGGDEEVISTGDPTMFQSPAWVEPLRARGRRR